MQSMPMPSHDHCGYEVAIAMLLKSISKKGKYADHLQYDSVRNLRTAFGNFSRASSQASKWNLSTVDQKGRYDRITQDECGSYWFYKFNAGMSYRMGNVNFPNVAMTSPLLLTFIKSIESKIISAETKEEQDDWVIFSAYCVISYTLSLRGVEGFLIDLKSTSEANQRNYEEKNQKYVIVCLLGKLKGEHQDNIHKIPCVNITKSGLNVKKYFTYNFKSKTRSRIFQMPLISDKEGYVLSTRDVNEKMHQILEETFRLRPHLFPPNVVDQSFLQNSYQCYRTFRRSSNTRATDQAVSPLDIDVVNRWHHQDAKSQGKRVSQSMKSHYCDFDKLLWPFLRYTKAM